MRRSAITVWLDDDLVPVLDELCKRSGRTRSDVMRVALKRHLARLRFEHLRGRVIRSSGARGFLVDEDVFDQVS